MLLTLFHIICFVSLLPSKYPLVMSDVFILLRPIGSRLFLSLSLFLFLKLCSLQVHRDPLQDARFSLYSLMRCAILFLILNTAFCGRLKVYPSVNDVRNCKRFCVLTSILCKVTFWNGMIHNCWYNCFYILHAKTISINFNHKFYNDLISCPQNFKEFGVLSHCKLYFFVSLWLNILLRPTNVQAWYDISPAPSEFP